VNGTAAPDLIRLEYCQWLNTKYWLLYDHLCVKLKLELGPYTKSLMAVSEVISRLGPLRKYLRSASTTMKISLLKGDET
jgi:hypothetical protein